MKTEGILQTVQTIDKSCKIKTESELQTKQTVDKK